MLTIKLPTKKDLIPLLFALKLFSDMFYQITFFDGILLALICYALLYYLLQYRFSFIPLDLIVLALMALVTNSVLKDLSGISDGIKILSAFLTYFLGRIYYSSFSRWTKYLYFSSNVVFVLNIAWVFLGFGVIQWGKAITLKGFYFMKTDFALLLAFTLIFTLMQKDVSIKRKALTIIPLVVCVIFANSRMYYLITLILFVLFFWYKKKSSLFISFRKFLIMAMLFFITILFLNNINRISLFANLNLKGVDVNSISDLFTNKVLNGRATIWGDIYEPFKQLPIITQWFGTQINYASLVGNANEHSMYIKMLICTGYIGIILFLVFFFRAYQVCVNITAKNREMAYITVMLLVLFILSGYSVSAIQKTANSWLPFFAIGAASSYNRINPIERSAR